jgi:hypothetical protein
MPAKHNVARRGAPRDRFGVAERDVVLTYALRVLLDTGNALQCVHDERR